MKSFRRSIKAVSPVIATIIIVAIAITMSIAVAYWMLGLGSSFTRYEKVEFTTAYVTGVEGNYVFTLDLKNTGSAAATIDTDLTLFNGKPSDYYNGTFTWAGTPALTGADTNLASMEPGKTYTLTCTTNSATEFLSGMTLEVMFRSTSGKDYPKVMTLP